MQKSYCRNKELQEQTTTPATKHVTVIKQHIENESLRTG